MAVSNVTVTDGVNSWAVSVMQSTAELAQGLSDIVSIPAQTGMLFDMGREMNFGVNAYHMLFPLDVVFMNGNLKVTQVVSSLLPGISSIVGTAVPARYFLEMNAGEAAATGVQVGDTITFTGYIPVPYLAVTFQIKTVMNMMVNVMIIMIMMKMMFGAMADKKSTSVTKK